MEIIELTAENVVSGINGIIKNQQECVVYGVPDKNYVFVGRNDEEQYNKEYCEQNDVELLKFPNQGGIIVSSNGDFDIGHFSKDHFNGFNFKFADMLINFLKDKGINATLVGNDILIDDKYKCGSFSSRIYGEILYSAFHISINVDLQMIKDICVKPMSMFKVPKGLSDYGITTAEIKVLFENFVEECKEQVKNGL